MTLEGIVLYLCRAYQILSPPEGVIKSFCIKNSSPSAHLPSTADIGGKRDAVMPITIPIAIFPIP